MAADSAAKRAKLITLLNVSAARNATKRKAEGQDWHEIARQAKRERLAAKASAQAATAGTSELVEAEEVNAESQTAAEVQEEAAEDDDDAEDEEKSGARTCNTSAVQRLMREITDSTSNDPWKVHYATENGLLTPEAIQAAKDASWITTRETNPALGRLARSALKGAEKTPPKEKKPVVGLY